MATIIAPGCWDLLHAGHIHFLSAARNVGQPLRTLVDPTPNHNRLIVAVNTDASAQRLKLTKWGEKYPIDDLTTRVKRLWEYADEVVSFDTEEELRGLIEFVSPCILVKGPDYAGKVVTGDDLAPVLILDTPEPESVKKLKIQLYGQHPSESCNVGTL